ncbi:hypothetical protein B5X24_HaOG208485 [Helicoverpa armigera]|uniref:Uncharacterized protein n=1 Tax=Helicoverpa armigera TaxID=29058 RepID=A0A2W1BFS1_HELAM|nr:hypothetical protein B5X24_HaOG208485 [Helicoverpa armigera]
MNNTRSDSESESASSSEEDLDSGIAEESSETRKEVDCMDLSEFFGYCCMRLDWKPTPTYVRELGERPDRR